MRTAEKIKKADALRKESNNAMKSLEKVTDKWTDELVKAATPKQRTLVNEKYTDLYSKADKKESKTYKRYYDFVDKNFEKTAVQKSLVGGNFMNKSFIDNLKRETIPKQAKPVQKKKAVQKPSKKAK